MQEHLGEKLSLVEKELAERLKEAEEIAERLMELGRRLKGEPWQWAIGWEETAFPEAEGTRLLEPEIESALDRQRLMWLLEDIRILRRREAELKRLLAA